MGWPRFCRVDTAERLLRFFFLVCLILLLAATESGAADGDAGAEEAGDGTPVRAVGDVTITATRGERDVLEVPGNVTVIEREEIQRSGARTIPDLLRREAGLFVTNTSTNPASFVVEARGFNNGGQAGSSLLVLVDGRRVNQADSGTTQWAQIAMDDVESIEIVRGPASALYGDNAVGGVINIRTRPGEGAPRATVRGRVGRYDSGGGSLRAAASWGRWTGSLFVDGDTTDGYRHGSDFDREDVDASLAVNLADRVVLGVASGYYQDDLGLPGFLKQADLDLLGRRARQPDIVSNSAQVKRTFVEGWIDALPAEGVRLRTQPSYRHQHDDALVTSTYLYPPLCGPDEVVSNYDVDSEKDSAGTEAHVQVDHSLFGRENRLIAGVDYLHEEVDRHVVSSDDCFGTSTEVSNLARDVYAAFLQNELQLTDELMLSGGVRFDRVELDLATERDGLRLTDHPDFDVWSPRAALTYRFLPIASAYVSYARGFRLPNFDEDVQILFPPGEAPTLPDLHPQISDAFELGAKVRSERVDASLALYQMEVRNEITFNPATFTNENFDRVRHRGIESSFTVWVLEWLSLYATYTFEDVEIRRAAAPDLEGRRMPMTPRHRGTVGVFAQLPWALELTANANFVGERIVSNDFDRLVDTLDRYATLDLLFAWRPTFGEHVEGALTFALRNVNGKKYDDFAARTSFPPYETGFYPAATRTWEAGLAFTVRR